MRSTISKTINIILLVGIAYLLLQKFVLNRPVKQIDVSQLVITDLQGTPIDWNELEGKAIFLNFWASWCGPCMAEMPSIKSSFNHFLEEEDLVYILANTESLADAQKIARSSKYDGLPFYVVQNSGEIEINSIPLTYLINTSGEVQKVHAGVNHWNTPITQNQIKNLLSP